MTLTTEDLQWLSEQAFKVLAEGMDGESDAVARLIANTGERFGDFGVYALCCGLAECITVLGKIEQRAGEWHGFGVFDLATGAQVDPDDAVAADLMVLGTRFMTAYLNRDADQTTALFGADPGKTAAAMAGMAGVYGRHRAEQHKADR